MTKRLRDNERELFDAAIAAGNRPRAPKAGKGLVLDIPGGRARKLLDVAGRYTPGGEYYYDATGQEKPNRGFDYSQQPVRRGSRLQIPLLDGQRSTLRTWDGRRRRWNFTKTGKEFYKNSLDRFVVTIPVIQTLVRTKNKDRSIYTTDTSVLKSTATPLGEISLPTLMPDEEQLAEVKRRAQAYLDSLPEADGHKVIFQGGGSEATSVLDPSRPLEYNKESISVLPDGSYNVEALLHRPLRDAKPWMFGFAGVCPEAYDQTESNCVVHQMVAVMQESLSLRESDLETYFDVIFEELYPAGSEDNPYEIEQEDGTFERRGWHEAGVTCAMIEAFGREHSLAVHVLWGETKVASYVPAEPRVTSLCLYVYGDHAFFASDPHTKSTIAKMKTSKPQVRPDIVLAVQAKSDAPPAKEWAEYEHGCSPGHYYADDLAQVRLELHARGICPRVQLSGVGVMKALRLPSKAGDVVIHRRRPEAFLCEAFAELFEKRFGRPLVYRGESLASFANKAFEELMRPPPRRQLTEEQYASLWEAQGAACNLCGAVGAQGEVDHKVPRSAGPCGRPHLEELELLPRRGCRPPPVPPRGESTAPP